MKGNKILEKFLKNKSNISLAMLFIALTLFFVISFKYIYKVEYKSLQGSHSWLSGSTIKFVSNWLSESPFKLHFVNFESPDSIEFNEITERGPYISYPSGCTFLVYCFAKIIGKTTIGVYFLKHLQILFFWLEVLFLSVFVYRFLSRNSVKSEKEKCFGAFFAAAYWALIPTNVWYLANVYFADQCIIFFVIAFLLVEYESYYCESKKKTLILNCLKSFLILAGVLIDYYFWILTFIAFVLQIVLAAKEKKSKKEIIRQSLWYIVPVLLALVLYAAELFSIPNWKNILKNKFLFRAGISQNKYNTQAAITNGLRNNFLAAFGLKNFRYFLWLLAVVFAYFDLKKKKASLSKNAAIITLGFLAPVLQVSLLKNHSAIHEFSMIKFGWCFAMFPILTSLTFSKVLNEREIFSKKWNLAFSPFFHIFLFSFILQLFITGFPSTTRNFYNSRKGNPANYNLAYILRNNTSYEHVCFSFSQEIPENPPQQLAISRKRVYKIKTKDEMSNRFPNLNPDAIKIFIIDKKNQNALTDEQKAVQLALESKNEVFYEDNDFCLLKIETLDTDTGNEIDSIFDNAGDMF